MKSVIYNDINPIKFGKLKKFIYICTYINLKIIYMNNLKSILYISIIELLIVSCNDFGSDNTDKYYSYTAYPFRSSDDANWGMISSDGKVIFNDEFQCLPTRVSNERFLVKNKDSLFTFYSAENKPKKIGKQYVYATDFNDDGVAVVSQPQKGIQVIDKKGRVVFSLDQTTGQQVDFMTPFNQDGLAIFSLDHNCGIINTEGKIILPPRYYFATIGNGQNILVIDKKYKETYERGNYKNIEVKTFHKDGSAISKFNLDKFILTPTCGDNYYVVCEKLGDDSIYGLIDKFGNSVVKPSKDIQKITDVKYDVFTYYDGDQYGLCDIKGQNLIRAKYDDLYIAGRNRLWAYENNGNVLRCKLIDFEDNQIGNNFYKFGSYFNNGWALAQIDDNDWIFVNNKGEENQNLNNISKINYNNSSNLVFSNYLNVETLLTAINIKDSSLNNFTFNMTVKDILNRAYNLNDSIYTGNNLSKDPEDFEYNNFISFSQDFHNTILKYKILFDKYIVVEDKFTEATPVILSLEIPYLFNANGRLTNIYIKLASSLKKLGKLVESNKNAIIIAGKSCEFFAAMAGDHILLNIYRKNSNYQKDIDISKYKDIKEENWLTFNPDAELHTDSSDFDDEDNTTSDTTSSFDYEY